MLCPLADDQTHATGRSMDQDRLAALHGMSAAYQVPGSHAFQHHRCRLLIGNAGRNRHQAIGWKNPLIGISADRATGIGDTVAWLEPGDTRSDFLDDTSRF